MDVWVEALRLGAVPGGTSAHLAGEGDDAVDDGEGESPGAPVDRGTFDVSGAGLGVAARGLQDLEGDAEALLDEGGEHWPPLGHVGAGERGVAVYLSSDADERVAHESS